MMGSLEGASVTVFGSSQPTEGSVDYEEARLVGQLLARAGFGVVNGGYGGTMEASSRGAREAGGSTLGVTLKGIGRHGPNQYLDRVVETQTLLERLKILLDEPVGFIALKGGSGTLAEIALAWEFNNKRLFAGRVEKPLVLLGELWEPLLGMIGREDTSSMHGDPNRSVIHAATPEAAVEFFAKRRMQDCQE